MHRCCGRMQKKLIAEVFQPAHFASNKLQKKRQERLFEDYMCEVEDPGSSQSLFQMRFDGVGQPGSAQ